MIRLLEKQARSPKISEWGVYEHIDHLLKVNDAILIKILGSERIDGGKNFLGSFALLSGWLPRGRGKSPPKLRGELASKESLHTRIEGILQQLNKLKNLPEKLADKQGVMKHIYFGVLNTAEWIKFIRIHNRHHLKIINDILK